MNITKKIKVKLLLLLMIGLMTTAAKERELPVQPIDKEALLKRHNYYREKVGVDPLVWSDELALYAQNWANHLSKSCDLVHSDGHYGENLYWTSGTASAESVVDKWASEEKYFNHKNPIYKSGSGHKSGHYSQIIWRSTTEVGGAMQKCKHGGEIWVCSYYPHGNVIGSMAY